MLQIDCDHDGTLTTREIKRLLRSLPKTKPAGLPEGTKMLSLDEIMNILDADKDGVISLQEFVSNLKLIPGLEASIMQNVDRATGKITTYKSLEHRLAEFLELAAVLEAKGEEGADELASLKIKIAEMQRSVGTVGITVFRQIDVDKSGKIDMCELKAVLTKLVADEIAALGSVENDPFGVNEIIATMDSDGVSKMSNVLAPWTDICVSG